MAKEEPLDDNERGVIVMTSSIAGIEGQIGQAAYSAAKGGIIGLTLPLARDLSAIGVHVVTIAPGTFRTPAYGQMPDEMVAHLESLTPFPKRMGRPDEFATLVEHICTNVMLNGEVIRFDAQFGSVRSSQRRRARAAARRANAANSAGCVRCAVWPASSKSTRSASRMSARRSPDS